MAIEIDLCAECRKAVLNRETPAHIVDPATMAAPADDMRGVLVCPRCGANWERFDHTVVLLG
jgi:Zn-finger nucleic acid-binding protein